MLRGNRNAPRPLAVAHTHDHSSTPSSLNGTATQSRQRHDRPWDPEAGLRRPWSPTNVRCDGSTLGHKDAREASAIANVRPDIPEHSCLTCLHRRGSNFGSTQRPKAIMLWIPGRAYGLPSDRPIHRINHAPHFRPTGCRPRRAASHLEVLHPQRTAIILLLLLMLQARLPSSKV